MRQTLTDKRILMRRSAENCSDHLTIPLACLKDEHLPSAGAKAVNLAHLNRAGLRVPTGFVLTTYAFKQVIQLNKFWDRFAAKLRAAKESEEAAIVEISAEILAAFRTFPVPQAIETAIHQAVVGYPEVEQWAVRSSATGEDSPMASFAGQHATYLKISQDKLIWHVRECWASLFSARALSYRVHNKIEHAQVAMAVILQQMLPAEISGVLFTADPVTGYLSRLIVESS